MKRRFLHCVAVIFLGVALIAGAGESGSRGFGEFVERIADAGAGESGAEPGSARTPLPESVDGFVSIVAPERFLADLFQYVEKVTDGTARPVSADMLGMMTMIFLPVPFDAWDASGEAQFYFAGDSQMPNVVFTVNSFDGLLEGLEGAGWTLSPVEIAAEAPFVAVRGVTMPDGGRMLTVADLGDGRAVLAANHDAVRAVLEEGVERQSDADVVVRIRADSVEDIRGNIMEALESGADGFVEDVADAGLTEEAGQWMLRMAEKYGDRLGAEIGLAEELRITLDLDGARADLGVGALFAGGAWTTRLAEALEAADAPEGLAAGLLPEGYYALTAGAPFTEIVPDAEAAGVEMLTDFAELVPEKKDALLDANRAFFAAGPGETAGAGYFNGGNPYSVSIARFDDPQAARDASLVFAGAMASASEKAFADPETAVTMPVEKVEEDGREWAEWRFEPVDEEAFAGFVENLNESMPGFSMPLSPDFRVYMARLDGALVTLAGVVGRDVFVDALEQIENAAADAVSPFDAPEIEGLVDGLGAARAGLSLVDIEQMYALIALQAAGLTPGEPLPEEPGPAQEAFLEVFDELEGGAEVAFGFGAEDGRVTLRAAVPAEAVNVIMKKYERFMAAENASPEERIAEAEEDAAEEAEDEAEDEAEEAAGE